jgi:hypothetical protein
MRQYAPFPTLLADIVKATAYKSGWEFRLIDVERDHESVHGGSAGGLTLEVLARTDDAYKLGARRSVIHYFPVPAATYDERSWRRWVLDCLVKIETHEACEFFRLEGPSYDDGTIATRDIRTIRPFAPNHGPGRDPYTIFDYATDTDRRTSFRGEVKETPDQAAKRIARSLTPGAD